MFLDIANRKDINIRIDGKFFKPRGVAMDDLPANVKNFFNSKYIDNGELFILLELLS
ncbi:hypothetical protein DSM106972_093300 [Dulcicalothrix desertica PCC 7102]|uniref:Uncharacterized protein n=1 Tax=Dulcicalothrix desertica PCC 7102 TaxID=232991 RepID=A0A433UKR0_9CYAN|nr:hypothetical protein DSM106972_093300 [Dulcicalothrix desertica PCC 7102]